MVITVGVLALQGAFHEHLILLRRAADQLTHLEGQKFLQDSFGFIEVRNERDLSQCDALIIPGGESTAISLVAAQSGLLEPLRKFVKTERKPTWGTCAGLILLAEAANATKKGGQDLIGGLDVRVNRNHFGRQTESFVAELTLPFLANVQLGHDALGPFPGVFIRAPVVERVLPNLDGQQNEEAQRPDTVIAPSKRVESASAQQAMSTQVDIMGVLPGRLKKAAEAGAKIDAGEETGDIIAVRQGNVFGTSFHPELTTDTRIHLWWLQQVYAAYRQSKVG